MGVWGYASSQFQGYDYVQTSQPSTPSEGETWYDVDADAAYVYDGASWTDMTVTDHGQLSGVTSSAHHSKPTSTQNTTPGGYWTKNGWSGQSLDWYTNQSWQWHQPLSQVQVHVNNANGDRVIFDNRYRDSITITDGSSTGWFSATVGIAGKGSRLRIPQDSNGETTVDAIEGYVAQAPGHGHSI